MTDSRGGFRPGAGRRRVNPKEWVKYNVTVYCLSDKEYERIIQYLTPRERAQVLLNKIEEANNVEEKQER